MSTQRERRSRGLDVMGKNTGAKAEPILNSMTAQHGPIASFVADHVLGNLWSRPQLSLRDRSMITIAFCGSIGAIDEFMMHVRGGVNNGLTRAQIEEIIVQVTCYAGFPMGLQASRLLNHVWCETDGVESPPTRSGAAELDDPERWKKASDVFRTLTGGEDDVEPAEQRAVLVEMLQDMGGIAFDFAFGEVWSREQLSRRDRSMVTVSILSILNCVEELGFHAPGALNHGVTRDELREVMLMLTVYGGFPKGVEGWRALQKAFDKLDGGQDSSPVQS